MFSLLLKTTSVRPKRFWRGGWASALWKLIATYAAIEHKH